MFRTNMRIVISSNHLHKGLIKVFSLTSGPLGLKIKGRDKDVVGTNTVNRSSNGRVSEVKK